MKKTFLILLISASFSRATVYLDGWLSLSNQTVGATATSTVLNNGTVNRGSGSWSITGTGSALTIGAHGIDDSHMTMVGFSNKPTSQSQRVLALNTASERTYAEFGPLPAGYRSIQLNGWIKFGMRDVAALPYYDMIVPRCNNGSAVYFQMQTGAGGQWNINIETVAGGTKHSAEIPVGTNIWYWFNFRVSFTAGTASLWMYNTNGGLVGNVSVNTAGVSGSDLNSFRIGNAEFGDAPGYIYFQDLGWDFSYNDYVPKPNKGLMCPPDRLADWTNAGFTVPNVTTVYTTLGANSTYQNVIDALAACPSNQVVMLAAGTHNWTGIVDFGGVGNGKVLRGTQTNGTNATTVIWTSTRALRMWGSTSESALATDLNITANIRKGDTAIKVAAMPSWCKPGLLLGIDQLNDEVTSTVNTGRETAGIYRAKVNAGSNGSRGQGELVLISATNATTITTAHPILHDHATNRTTQIFMPYYDMASQAPRTMCGVENIDFVGSGGASTDAHAIQLIAAYKCWVKGCGSFTSRSRHIFTQFTYQCVISGNYCYDAFTFGPGQGCGISLFDLSCRNLVENNIVRRSSASYQVGYGSSANVFGYNYALESHSDSGEGPELQVHGNSADYNLFEGNCIDGKATFDCINGSSYGNSLFRNRLVGYVTTEIQSGNANNQIALNVDYWNRDSVVVGNVCGSPGFHDAVQIFAPNSCTSLSKCVYKWGFVDAWGCDANVYDPYAALNLVFHGNYDTVTGGVIWDPSITNHVLPNSLYLSSKPVYFGNLSWPLVDPNNPRAYAGFETNSPAGYRYASLTNTPPGSTQQPPVITWGNPGAVTYGAALSGAQLNATANVPGTFVYSPAAGTVLNAGNAQGLGVTFTPSDTANYTTATKTVLMDVQKAPLTISANNKSKVYGAGMPELTVSYSGFVNGDAVASLTTPATLGTAASTGSAVGSYTISASGATAANYTITHVNGTLTVTPSPLTITADDKSRLFVEPNPPLTANYAGFVNGDTVLSLDVGVNLTTTAAESSPAGTYPILASGAVDANYNITHINGTLTVEAQSAPVVTLSAGSLSYAENAGPVLLDPSATVTDADSTDFDTGLLTVAFAVNGDSDDRLAIRNQGSGAGEIGVAGNQVSYADALVGTYAGGNNGTTPLVVSLNANATPEAAQALVRNVSYENVASTPSTLARTVRVVVTDGDGGSSVPVTRTISVTGVPESPVLSWGNPSAIGYGTALSGAQLNATATVPGTFAYSPVAGTVLNAGNGQVLTVVFTPTDSQNYIASTNTVFIDVQKAPLTISADNQNKVYGAAVPGLTASYAGFVNGDTAASLTTPVSLGTTASAGSAVGGYAVTAGGATSGNYTITHVDGLLTVTSAPLTITGDNKSRLVDQPNPPLTASYAGLVNGDTVGSLDVGVSLTTPATESSPAGSYPIVAGGAADANYTITHVNGTLTVTNPPAPGTVGTLSFTNATAITIPGVGTATPYPSTNHVTGLSGTISNVTVTLYGITHARIRDIDILLVGPGGQKIIVLSDVGPNGAVSNVTLSLSDAAATSLGTGGLVSGTYKPTDITAGDTFAAPAPAGPYGTNFGVFKGTSPNGSWSLYVVDDNSGSAGTIGGGWSVTVTTMGPQAPYISAIANQSLAVNTATAVIPFTIGDVDTAVGSLTLSGGSSNTNVAPTENIVFGGSGTNRTVTVSPAAGQTGSATITVSVSDGQNTTSTNFVVTVSMLVTGTRSFTNAPAITIPSQGAAAPYPSVINVAGMGSSVSNVMVTLYGITHARMRDIDILLVGPGGQKLILLSDLGPNNAVNNVTLTLSDAAATSLSTGSIVSGTYKPTDITPGDSFVAPAPAGPYGTNFGVFKGTSPNGVWSLYVVDDNSGSTGTIAGGWSVTVTAMGPQAPFISGIANQTINVNGTTGPLSFTIGDGDTAVGSLTLSGGSSNTNLVPTENIVFGGGGTNRTVTVSPAAGQTGSATITVSVSDEQNTTTANFVVTVSGVNTPPPITGVADQTINEDASTAALTFTVGDAESAASSLTISGSSSNLTLVATNDIIFGGSGGNRTVTVIPTTNQFGLTLITLTVSDGILSTSTNFTVTVNAVNDAPTITGIANQTINVEGTTGPLNFTVRDVDTAVGSLTLSGGSSNTNLVPTNNIGFGGSGTNRTVTVSPAAGQTGSATITVTVSDGSLTASDSFVLTVNAVNTPPTITGVADQTIHEDTGTGPLNFTVGDVESAASSLTFGKGSSNLTLVPTNNIVFGGSGINRTVTVIPATNQFGSTLITLTVSDGVLSTSTNFLVTVNAVNDGPTITGIANQTINVNGTTGPLNFTIGDVDTAVGSLTLSGESSNTNLVSTNNIVFGGNGTNRTVAVTPAVGQTGSATITVSVSDGQLSASNSFVVTVSSLFTGTKSFTNSAAITIPDSGAGTPYPSIINVTGMGGTISNMTVTLRSLSHTWGNDVDVLLIGPGGQAVRVMENAGSGTTANANLTFSNNAAVVLPKTGALASGTYKPTAYTPATTYPSPVPGASYGTNLTVFNGTGANGVWSLYVFDDGPGDLGSFAGGWSLTITTGGLSQARVASIRGPLQITAVTYDNEGTIRVKVSGEVGESYALEASSDLVNWVKVDVRDNVTGSIVFNDQPTGSMRFYRAVSMPK